MILPVESSSHSILRWLDLGLSTDAMNSQINAILEFRNQEVMKANGIQLQKIAENDSEGKKAVADIAQWTYNDSRTMRIATVIAMLYLPASLVLVSHATVPLA